MRKKFAAALGAALVAGLAWSALGAGAADRRGSSTLSSAEDAGARSAARRATATYKGAFKQSGKGTKIAIKVRVRNGEAKSVKSMTYQKLPAVCPESNFDEIGGGWTFRGGVPVNDQRRFSVVGNDGDEADPSSLRFRGRFSKNFKRVRGKFQTRAYFPETPNPGGNPDPLPEETCVGAVKRYGATR
jgi:hypothetical protein